MHIDWPHIIKGCKNQLPQQQEQLYRYCYGDMMKICRRYSRGNADEAASIYNQAMLKVFQNMGQYNGTGAPEAWIRRITINSCIDHLRSRVKFQQKGFDNTSVEMLTIIPDVYNRMSGNEISNLINELPKNTGLVFNLFAIEGYKHTEIATILGISAGTSKWHLNEARKILKQKLELLFKKEYLANVI